jgi:hypothetical protein
MTPFRILLLSLCLGLAPGAAFAQYDDVVYYDDEYDYDYDDYAFEYEPYSGDPEFDLEVAALNLLVGGDAGGFASDLSSRYGAPREQVITLVVERHYPPDYLWTVAATAKAANRPWNEVFPLFEQQRTQASGEGRGWGATAQRLGIKPGSPAFHALKNDLRAQKGKWKNKPRKSGATMTTRGPATVDPGQGRGQGRGAPQGAGKAKDKGQGKGKGQGQGKGQGKGKQK